MSNILEDGTIEPEVNETTTSVKIGDDVVSVIAGLAASEVEGVAGMSGGIAGGIAELVGRKSMAKGVKVELKESDAVINLNIIVNYGAKIPEIAENIQNNVKSAVETMTGLNVQEINIYVQGVSFPQPAEEVVVEEEITEEE